MLSLDDYNDFCGSLPAAAHVVQWGGAYVWKVGGADGKVFAIAGWAKDSDILGVTFKVSDIAYEILKEQQGCRPAPYLASRGMKWIQAYAEPGLSGEELKSYLVTSHKLASQNLTKKRQKELGLNQDD